MTVLSPNASLTLFGCGLVRFRPSSVSAINPAARQSLSQVAASLSSFAPQESNAISQLLISPDHQAQQNGMRRFAQLFLDTPQVRETVVRALKTNEYVAEKMNVWNDVSWMRTVDFLVGLGELAPTPTFNFFEHVRSRILHWSQDFGRATVSKQEIQEALVRAYQSEIERIATANTIRNHDAWKNALPLLWKFWIACDVLYVGSRYYAQSMPISPVITLLRALTRLELTPGVDPQIVQRFQKRVNELLHDKNDTRFDDVVEAIYNLYEYIILVTPIQDPLLPLEVPGSRESLRARLDPWLEKISAQHIDPSNTRLDMLWMMLLRRVRKDITGKFFTERLVEIVFSSHYKLYERVRELMRLFVESWPTAPDRASFVPRTTRLITWNPYAVDDDIVLHNSIGEGRLLSGPDAEGMVTLRMIGQGDTLKVLASKITPATSKTEFLNALEQRAERNRQKAVLFAAAALGKYLSSDDPAQSFLDAILFKPPEYSVNRIRRDQICSILVGKRALPSQERFEYFSGKLLELGRRLGFDPIAWCWRMTAGVYPGEVLSNGSREGTMNRERVALHRIITPDLVRSLAFFRPWQREWQDRGSSPLSNLMTAGYYYPTYYQGAKKQDLTKLYFDFREGNPAAVVEVAELMQPLVDQWAQTTEHSGKTLLVPMIGTAPNEKLADFFGQPVLFPWLPRPLDYGEGVEGKLLFQKMLMVNQALRLNPECQENLKGAAVLIVDDNVTDYATWMVARKLLYDAGAADVGLVALTQTMRRPEDFSWILP